MNQLLRVVHCIHLRRYVRLSRKSKRNSICTHVFSSEGATNLNWSWFLIRGTGRGSNYPVEGSWGLESIPAAIGWELGASFTSIMQDECDVLISHQFDIICRSYPISMLMYFHCTSLLALLPCYSLVLYWSSDDISALSLPLSQTPVSRQCWTHKTGQNNHIRTSPAPCIGPCSWSALGCHGHGNPGPPWPSPGQSQACSTSGEAQESRRQAEEEFPLSGVSEGFQQSGEVEGALILSHRRKTLPLLPPWMHQGFRLQIQAATVQTSSST